MATYRALITTEVPTRTAATLVGIPQARATRKPRTTPLLAATVAEIFTRAAGHLLAIVPTTSQQNNECYQVVPEN